MKAVFLALFFGVLMALTACSGEFSGTARGLFVGYVTDRTEEEVSTKFGKPVAVEAQSTTMKWTYKRKTFDPDNQSLVDEETILIFQKDGSGKFKVVQVIFG